MTVKAILAAKGGDVVCIEPTASLAEAAKVMSERRIGALVILGADSHVTGVLSERDIVHALAARGGSVLQEQVGHVMTRHVMTCTDDETICRVMERMTSGKFRHLPVVNNGRLIGIVSIGDVVKSRVEEIERETEVMRDYIRTA